MDDIFEVYLNEFSQFLEKQERSQLTISGYKNDICLIKKWVRLSKNQQFTIDQLTSDLVKEYKQFLINKNAHPRTISRRLASMAIFALWAQSAGYIPEGPNPVQGTHSIKNVIVAPRWLTDREKTQLIRVVNDEVTRSMLRLPRLGIIILRDATIVKVLVNTGLRIGELSNLKITDIHLGKNQGLLVVRSGKGAKRREIPLNLEARKAINMYLLMRSDLSEEMLFLDQDGSQIEKRTAQRAVSRFAKIAGLKGVSCHTLRHTFAKNLIDQNVSIEKVSLLLGHTNLNTTKIYITPSLNDLEDAVGKLDPVD